MTTKVVCDMCGEVISPGWRGSFHFNGIEVDIRRDYESDLCSRCCHKVLDFINRKREEAQ